MRYDIAIVGDGPAGLAASINAKIRNKNIILFGSGSDKLAKAPSIDNYLGIYDVSGAQLKDKFIHHITEMGIEITYERVNNVYSMGDYFSLAVGDKTYEAITVIIATGVQYGKMIKGEDKYLGKGVGYCATCDAGLYRDKVVAIIGYNHEGEEDANFLSEIASKVYYIPMYNLDNKLDSSIEIINDKPVEIQGEKLVNKLILKERELDVDGVFIMKDSVSPSYMVPGLEVEGPHIKTDREMRTNIDGLYAAGDCAGKPYQYLKSAGQGQMAVSSAISQLDKLRINKIESKK
ncbi:MAG: NAD(P)/FAD-dependent oxidoreductase [Paeniclostridium sordellii]|uniref:NAD(P)/FAD-dependent oxidoreductase n=1 Tax=Paeniclostridium hominis TaxID=2764329 RepID=A0ABR7K7D3_9FIRM|nr:MULTISPECIES: NAD(P)/FAD-dependent oxidoreductase [Paeniclostridium]MBC6004995.1 NAD(P)/FAD-dependent oxidoreductase [Paeniclostridium hominis]MDU2592436.1 NAD(P)/FAD-dependent oxidoreductase [Paeniclostridium sordellii]